MSERRLGYIVATKEFLADAPPNLWELVGGTVLGENPAEHEGDKRFLLNHPEFDLLTEHGQIPHYLPYFTRHPDDTVTRDHIERCQ